MMINDNGIDMFYEKCGIGRPLILVHGNSGCKRGPNRKRELRKINSIKH